MPELPFCNLEKLNLTIDGKSQGMLIVSAVYRARIPGGWLVLAGHNNAIGGVTFCPDTKHEWKGDNLPG